MTFTKPPDDRIAEAAETVAEIYDLTVEEAEEMLNVFIDDLFDEIDREEAEDDYDRAMRGI